MATALEGFTQKTVVSSPEVTFLSLFFLPLVHCITDSTRASFEEWYCMGMPSRVFMLAAGECYALVVVHVMITCS